MHAEIPGILLRLLLGCVVGFTVGLTGIGGGVLTLPSLTLILRLPPSLAVGTTSLCVFLTTTYSSYRHFRLKNVAAGAAGLFLLGAIPGNLAVSLLITTYLKSVHHDPASLRAFQTSIKHVIVAVILLSAVMLTINLARKGRGTESWRRGPERTNRDSCWPRRIVAVLLGAIVGGLVGATSIGGAIMTVPVLILILGLSPSRTVGTSTFIALVLTMLTSLIYGGNGEAEVHTAVLMAAGAWAGVYWGSRLSMRTSEKLLQCLVILVILFSVALMLLQKTP